MAESPSYVTEPLARWKRVADPLLLALAIGSLPILLLEIDKAKLPSGEQTMIDVANLVILIAFGIDYLVGLYLTDQRSAYLRGEWINLLIVVSSAAAIAPDLGAAGSARALRALRPLRAVIAIVRALTTGGLAARDGRQVLRRNAVRFAAVMTTLIWLSTAAAFTVAEDVGVGSRVGGFTDALWWSAATITTVGYGDIVPVTLIGRLVALVAMVAGISTFAIVTARSASFLVDDE